jgi:3-oxoacyl-[acyl-carrier protein] reductase
MEWDHIIDVNLKGTFFFSQAVIDVMKEQAWGRIINLSSYAG